MSRFAACIALALVLLGLTALPFAGAWTGSGQAFATDGGKTFGDDW